MIRFVICLVLVAGSVELSLGLPFLARIKTLLLISRRALKIILSPSISDHWKEKAVLRYAGRLAASTLALAFFLGVVALYATLVVVVADRLDKTQSTLAFVQSLPGIGVLTALSIAYLKIRAQFV